MEIGSGSGEHEVVFQKCFPEIICKQVIQSQCIGKCKFLDWEWRLNQENASTSWDWCRKYPWKVPLGLANSLQGIFSINMFHVAGWSRTNALFSESENYLEGDNFECCMDHLKLALSIQVKVMILW